MSIVLNPTRPDLVYTGARVHAPSRVLYGPSSAAAYHPRLDSAHALNERHAGYEAALEDESIDPLTRSAHRLRVMLGRPVSGDLAALVRAGATLPAPDTEETRVTTDERALDTIAGLLGTAPDWAYADDYLEDIATTIASTGRPDPRSLEDSYEDAFIRETGRQLPDEAL